MVRRRLSGGLAGSLWLDLRSARGLLRRSGKTVREGFGKDGFPGRKNKKMFKFICSGHREGISRDGAAFFKGG